MRLLTSAREARETLLRRRNFDEPDLPPAVREVTRRVFGAELDAAAVVDRILRDVRQEGDAAVRRYNEAIDGVSSTAPLEVSRSEVKQAYDDVEASLVEALRHASTRIWIFHERQLAHSLRSFEQDG